MNFIQKDQIHMQEYYRSLTISDHLNELRLTHSSSISSLDQETKGCYFEVNYYSKPHYYLIILEFNLNQLVRKYKYSRKGNLAWIMNYRVGKKKYIVKTIYDYSLTSKRIQEKRFYTNKLKYLKKELYDKNERIQAIHYFREGTPYYIEYFNTTGILLKSDYFHENGLKIK